MARSAPLPYLLCAPAVVTTDAFSEEPLLERSDAGSGGAQTFTERPAPGALGSLAAWLLIGLAVLLSFPLQALLFVACWPFDPLRRVSGLFFRRMSSLGAGLNPYWDFACARAPAAPTRPTVVVANHASNVDPFLVCQVPFEMKWLGKASLFRVPLLGWSMALAGDIPVRRGAHGAGHAALAACARWVERGMPVIIFPEGTRSKDGALGPFKDGAFKLAVETGADVLPLGLWGTHEALPKHSWRVGRSRGRLVAGAPIPSAGKTVAQLKAEVRAAVERLVREASLAI